MKNILFLLSLVSIPFLSGATDGPDRGRLSGIWENRHGRREVLQIREVRGGLEVKYLDYRWRYYERIDSRKFVDGYGSYIFILGNGAIRHRHFRNRRVEIFYLARPFDRDSRDQYPDRYDEGWLEGSWRMQETGSYLFIQLTDSGLRAKSEDLDRWYYYRRIGQYRYADDRGNEYVLLDNGVLRWTNERGTLKFWFDKEP